jgi:hypothetical protein
VIATGQPYPQHNLCHGQHPMVAWLSTDVAVTAPGPPAERTEHSRPTERPVAWDVPRAQSHVNMAVPWTYASRPMRTFLGSTGRVWRGFSRRTLPLWRLGVLRFSIGLLVALPELLVPVGELRLMEWVITTPSVASPPLGGSPGIVYSAVWTTGLLASQT